MDYLAAGGVWMWIIAALDGIGVVLVLIGLVAALIVRFAGKMQRLSRMYTFSVLLGAIGPAIAGGVGWQAQRKAAWSVIGSADPETRVVLLQRGYDAAQYPLTFGIVSTLVLGFCALMPFILTLPPADP